MTGTLSTVGYQGLAVGDLFDALRGAGVARVLDIRAVPLSRKPGFGRRQLAAACAERGIDYVHLPGLGTPKEGRDAARRGDRAALERVFCAHLATDTARNALLLAQSLVTARPSCLLCFESDPACCHRRLVADALGPSTGLVSHHLRPVPSAVLRGHGAT